VSYSSLERRDGISLREPFVRPEKQRCASTLTRGRGGPTGSNVAFTNDRHSGLPIAGVTFDQTAAKCLAPRHFS
jgi:hypothetical protein